VLFDCPGQVELFTHHESLRNIFFRIQKMGYRVRISLPPSRAAMTLWNDYADMTDGSARSPSPHRLLCSDVTFIIHIDATPVSPRHVPDGSAPPQRPHQNRQIGRIRPATFQLGLLHRSA